MNVSVVPAKCNTPESIVITYSELFKTCHNCDRFNLLLKSNPFLKDKE